MGQWGQCWGERAEFTPNFPHFISCPPLFRSCPPNCGAGKGGGGLWVMARALPGPAAIWLVAEGGLANYSHRITLCTTAPACRGREGGRTRGEGAKPQESAWRMDGECSGAKEREEGSQGGAQRRCGYINAKKNPTWMLQLHKTKEGENKKKLNQGWKIKIRWCVRVSTKFAICWWFWVL